MTSPARRHDALRCEPRVSARERHATVDERESNGIEARGQGWLRGVEGGLHLRQRRVHLAEEHLRGRAVEGRPGRRDRGERQLEAQPEGCRGSQQSWIVRDRATGECRALVGRKGARHASSGLSRRAAAGHAVLGVRKERLGSDR